jgi:hypothetical protein
MFKKFPKTKIATFTIIIFLLLPILPVVAMTKVKDVISTSEPGVPANHVISFLTTAAIPAGGKIVITPQAGVFFIMPGFDYTDIDLATSSSATGPFLNRVLATSSSFQADEVEVTASTTSGQIVFNLRPTYGIATSVYVQIKLGTNATYGYIGDQSILNATTTGSYYFDIQTRDAANNLIKKSRVMLAMITPVVMGAIGGKIRSNGRPTGVLAYGTTQTQMSLNTNYRAICRYSTTASTSYANMTNEFSYTGAYFHSITITGLRSGHSYTYYIRCRDQYGTDDTTDYIISFFVSGQPGEEGEESGNPGPGGGGAGGGGGGGFGHERGRGTGKYLPYPPPPGAPGVILTGWSYAGQDVTILKDGTEAGLAAANVNGEFGAFLEDLAQGVYTFSVWAADPEGKKSNTYSTIFWIDAGTQSTVSDIIISPTIYLNKTSFSAGENVEVRGYAVPTKTVEIWLEPDKNSEIKNEEIIKKETTAGADSHWSTVLNTNDLTEGSWRIKARTTLETIGQSEFSQPAVFTLGAAATESAGTCPGADLNGDGRVNITDFSILLYWWGTDNDCADQNQDGKVDLIDFSIMMYHWTG